MQEFQVECE